MKTEQKLGIYIHLPFCKKKCDYCDFYSISGEKTGKLEEIMNQYQKALLAHMALLSPSATLFSVDTIYFGGGTPSFYGASRIDALLRAIKKGFCVERTAEITVEGNPESVDKKFLQTLRRGGVNRISLGIQSTNHLELSSVGRIHSSEDSRKAVSLCKSLQIKNLSLDLIYGLPQQTIESWAETVEEAIALEPEHISCYGLKVEEGTALFSRVAQGETLIDEDKQAQMYLWTVERLAKAGFLQYEISNFAKDGYHSRHNLGYWQGKPYLGFGASAASDFGGYRSTLVGDITAYCDCVLSGGGQIFSSNQLVGQGERNQEHLMLRLRTNQGISGQEYERECGLDFLPLSKKLKEYQKEAWADCSASGHWHLTAEGYLRSNLLIGELLDVQEESQEAPSLPLIEPKPLSTKEEAPSPVSPLVLYEEEETGQFCFDPPSS
ncbi:MAG: radical SAM family heme chaperone HemW [Eubacteriales bacterium]